MPKQFDSMADALIHFFVEKGYDLNNAEHRRQMSVLINDRIQKERAHERAVVEAEYGEVATKIHSCMRRIA